MFSVISANKDSFQASIEPLQPNNGPLSACNGHSKVAMCVADNKCRENSWQPGIAGAPQVIAGLQS
jgi:hypothetical protein